MNFVVMAHNFQVLRLGMLAALLGSEAGHSLHQRGQLERQAQEGAGCAATSADNAPHYQ